MELPDNPENFVLISYGILLFGVIVSLISHIKFTALLESHSHLCANCGKIWQESVPHQILTSIDAITHTLNICIEILYAVNVLPQLLLLLSVFSRAKVALYVLSGILFLFFFLGITDL